MPRILLALALLCCYCLAAPRDSEHLVCRGLFKTGKVSLKDSTVEIEPLLPPLFVASWMDGDLKQVPKEKMLLTCDVYEYEHDGGHYTKLSCPDLGDVFVKTVLFSGEKK